MCPANWERCRVKQQQQQQSGGRRLVGFKGVIRPGLLRR